MGLYAGFYQVARRIIISWHEQKRFVLCLKTLHFTCQKSKTLFVETEEGNKLRGVFSEKNQDYYNNDDKYISHFTHTVPVRYFQNFTATLPYVFIGFTFFLSIENLFNFIKVNYYTHI